MRREWRVSLVCIRWTDFQESCFSESRRNRNTRWKILRRPFTERIRREMHGGTDSADLKERNYQSTINHIERQHWSRCLVTSVAAPAQRNADCGHGSFCGSAPSKLENRFSVADGGDVFERLGPWLYGLRRGLTQIAARRLSLHDGDSGDWPADRE